MLSFCLWPEITTCGFVCQLLFSSFNVIAISFWLESQIAVCVCPNISLRGESISISYRTHICRCLIHLYIETLIHLSCRIIKKKKMLTHTCFDGSINKSKVNHSSSLFFILFIMCSFIRFTSLYCTVFINHPFSSCFFFFFFRVCLSAHCWVSEWVSWIDVNNQNYLLLSIWQCRKLPNTRNQHTQ